MKLESDASSANTDFDIREFTFWLVRHQQAVADRLGINITDFKCLGVLHRKGAVTPKALAEDIAVSPAAMTTIIDRLEKAGYVRRKRGGDDRRSLKVHATEQSVRKATKLYKSLADESARLNAEFTQQELEIIWRYLRRATIALHAATMTLVQKVADLKSSKTTVMTKRGRS